MSSGESAAGLRVFGEDEENQEEEEEYVSEESVPSGKRLKVADIWEGFSILKQRGSKGSSAKCTACTKLLANSGTSGTSLWRYFDSSFKSQTGPDFDAARRAMAMFIITSGESLSLVENHYLQALARSLNPLFPLCRSILDNDVINLYNKERDMLSCIISQASGGLSLSIDYWKSKATGDKYIDDKYICVTACFVDADWNLQRRIVGFRLLDFTDDSASVAETVASCFDELDVDKKVMCITLDNALYDASVINSLKTILHDEGKLVCNGELLHIHCCTDVLSLAVQAGFELIADLIEKIRQGIHYINFSAVSKDKFYKYAKDICHLDVTVKLRADIVVYWDLTYKMIGCALYYKDALKHFASTDETFLSNFHLTDEEWNKVATMEKFLKPLYDITCTFLRKTKTASLYFLGLYKVHRLLDVTKGQQNFMYAMVEDVKAKFDKYWSENSLMLACAAVFDPRYKLNLISYCFRRIYGDADASEHIGRVVALIHRLFAEYEKSSCSSSVGTKDEYHTKDDLFDDYAAPKQISGLDWYLESPTMDLNVCLDILEFWSGISKCYPKLANLARDILAVPISTVASKSAFTIGEKVLNHRRSALDPVLLEVLICLHDWTCPKDRNGIAVSAIEEYCTDDEDEEDIKESDDNKEGEKNVEGSDYADNNYGAD
ncbi:hypothetical protein ACP70R_009216 [Stipagrostis hirtigluma subsp. patula]